MDQKMAVPALNSHRSPPTTTSAADTNVIRLLKKKEMGAQRKLSTGTLLQAKSTASRIIDWGMGSVITALAALAVNEPPLSSQHPGLMAHWCCNCCSRGPLLASTCAWACTHTDTVLDT